MADVEQVAALEDVWFHAYESRDRRFDGVFFLGVKSTYIYCRPICPARTPKRRNVRFFQTATAAEAAGFRACKKCKPERSPLGTLPSGIPDVVRKSQHLIARGYLGGQSVEDLANVVGVTSRHLRRLFLTHLGMTPQAIAQSQRLQVAKRLIEQTSLPLTQIAFESGFRSVRAFNLRIREAFDVAPSELRRSAKGKPGAWTVVSLRVGYRPDYPWQDVRDRLVLESLPGTWSIGNTHVSKLLMLDEEISLVRIRHLQEESCFQMEVHYRSPPTCTIRSFVTQAEVLLDTAADPMRLERFFAAHRVPHLGERLRLVGALDPLEMAVRQILLQKMKRSEASGFMQQLCEDVEPEVASEFELTRVFPCARRLASKLSDSGCGSVESIIGLLSHRVAAGEIELYPTAEPDRLRNQLMSIDGIGRRAAAIIAMRATGYPDFAISDDAEATRWRPWRSYAFIAGMKEH